MSTIRHPRNLNTYITATAALQQLQHLMNNLRQRSAPGDLMRWDMKMNFFNPGWMDGSVKPSEFVTQRSEFKSLVETPPVDIAASAP